MAKVLIVDDDAATCRFLVELVHNIGHSAEAAHSLAEGTRMGLSGEFNVVFLDVRLPDGSGLELLPRLKELPMAPEVIIMTGQGDPSGVELAIRNGAWDYLQKPLSPKKILLPLKRVLQYRDNLAESAKSEANLRRSGVVGDSYAIKLALKRMWEAAQSDAAVLLLGETGTGKELFARALHNNSARSSGRFVTVDCTAIPDNLMASTLLGHVRGAFTGADHASGGLVREADGGTLFLDEIGDLPLESQSKFLRVLQEKRFIPIGGKDEVTSDFRLVAATNQDLEAKVAQGTFRRDLLYRLQTMSIFLPPLKERLEDIPLLVEHFNQQIASRYRIEPKQITPEVLEILSLHNWSGNVRELASSLESSIVAAMHEPVLFSSHLPEKVRTGAIQAKLASVQGEEVHVAASSDGKQSAVLSSEAARADNTQFSGSAVWGGNTPWSGNIDGQSEADEAVAELQGLPSYKEFKEAAFSKLERQYLEQVLAQTHWNVTKACSVSGLGRSRFYSLLRKHNITR